MVSRGHRARLGWAGETVALAWLLLKGYRLRARRWRIPGGELDLVMERRGVVVFVEVRTRSSRAFGGALGSIGPEKRRRMVRAAEAYLSRYGLWNRPSRYDVVAIQRDGGPLSWRLRHIRGAFEPGEGRLL